MPQSVNNAVSAGVMPKSLCTSLVETREVPIITNTYHDGTCQRKTLAATSRKRFKIGKRLTASELNTLRSFYEDMIGKAFTVYPLASDYDNAGQSLTGRYLVRFEGGWSESIGLGRHDARLELVEVA